MSKVRSLLVVPTLALVAIFLAAPPAPALGKLVEPPLHVTKQVDTNDGACDDDCSLREAVVAANSDGDLDTILVPPGTYLLSRHGRGENQASKGDLDITMPVVVRGAGAASTFVRGSLDRLFEIRPGASATIAKMTLRDGNPGADAGGGAILADGDLTLKRVAVVENTANDGGGVANNATLSVVGSRFTGNTTMAGTSNPEGGGIYSNGPVTLLSSTFNGNVVDANAPGIKAGGGVHMQGSTLVARNTTFANNTAVFGGGLSSTNSSLTLSNVTVAGNDGSGVDHFTFDGSDHVAMSNTIVSDSSGGNCNITENALDSGGHNISDDETCDLAGTGDQQNTAPGLTALGANGGPVPTMALAPASHARNHGASCELKDARGVVRPQGPACDVGAYEAAVAVVTKPVASEVHVHTFPVAWTAPRPGAATFDVRYRRHAVGGTGGAFHPVRTNTALRQVSFTAEDGFEYCFSARAIDLGGHASLFGPERCAEVTH